MIRIKNARIVEKNQLKTVNIYIEKGKIEDILPGDKALLSTKKEIDAKGNIVFPGFIKKKLTQREI